MGILKKTMANGKIIICDFRKLKKGKYNFVGNIQEPYYEFIRWTQDGQLYINSATDICDFAAEMFEILMGEDMKTLSEYEEFVKEEYPNATLDNICDYMQDEKLVHIFAGLCVPAEKKRRQFEKSYRYYVEVE